MAQLKMDRKRRKNRFNTDRLNFNPASILIKILPES